MVFDRCLILVISLFFSLNLQAQKNVVSSFKISGNNKTKSKALEKLFSIKKGDILDTLQINQDIRILKRLPAVSHAYFKVSPNNSESGYDVVYTVQENFTILPTANIYETVNEELAYRIGLSEFNLLGQNITLGGFYQKDIFDSYQVFFRAPFLFNKKAGIALNYTNLTTREPVFLDNGTANYKYNNTAYEALGLYQFDFHHRVEFGASFFTEVYNYIDGQTDPSVPQNLDVDKFLFKLIYECDNLDYHFQYVTGFKSTLNAQYVTSSDAVLPNFIIAWNDFSYFKRIKEKGNWASRLRLGLATNDDSPFAPFAVDNNLNVRGVGSLIDRGTGVIVLNTEYRHTLYDKKSIIIQSNFFIDGGSWRNPKGDFGDFIDSDNVRLYPGAGFRFIHKKLFNAVFRVDYGYGITKDASQGIVFGIGQYF